MEINKVYVKNCNEFLKEIDIPIDLVFIDPPFGIDFKENTTRVYSQGLYKSQVPKEIYYDDFTDGKEYSKWSKEWIKNIYNVLKEEGVFVLVSGWSNVSYLDLNCREAGFKILNHCIWKYEFGVNCTKKFVTSHYHILVYVKTKNIEARKFTFNPYKKYMEDVITHIRRTDKEKLEHPCSMTPKLPELFIRVFSNEGDTIVDCFAGVGATLISSKKNRRNYLGCDTNKSYVDICLDRLSKTHIDKRIDWFKTGENFFPKSLIGAKRETAVSPNLNPTDLNSRGKIKDFPARVLANAKIV